MVDKCLFEYIFSLICCVWLFAFVFAKCRSQAVPLGSQIFCILLKSFVYLLSSCLCQIISERRCLFGVFWGHSLHFWEVILKHSNWFFFVPKLQVRQVTAFAPERAHRCLGHDISIHTCIDTCTHRYTHRHMCSIDNTHADGRTLLHPTIREIAAFPLPWAPLLSWYDFVILSTTLLPLSYLQIAALQDVTVWVKVDLRATILMAVGKPAACPMVPWSQELHPADRQCMYFYFSFSESWLADWLNTQMLVQWLNFWNIREVWLYHF